jgi:hypothetical protein
MPVRLQRARTSLGAQILQCSLILRIDKIALTNITACFPGSLSLLTFLSLMRHKIHVNQLDIGWMNSDSERALVLSETGDPAFIDRAAAAKPFGRILDPKEVARAVLWMASDDSGMMTGAVIPFDQSVFGGYDDAPTPAAKLEA